MAQRTLRKYLQPSKPSVLARPLCKCRQTWRLAGTEGGRGNDCLLSLPKHELEASETRGIARIGAAQEELARMVASDFEDVQQGSMSPNSSKTLSIGLPDWNIPSLSARVCQWSRTSKRISNRLARRGAAI